MAKSRLTEILNEDHSNFCKSMSDFFGLEPELAKPLGISFDEENNCEGLFDNNGETPVIYFNPNESPDFQEARFTIAHETGHYFHYLKRPEFYNLSAHPELNNKKGFENFKSLQLITQFRELVADMASFEFFRRKNLLKPFLNAKKKETLKNWEVITRTGDYRRRPFAALVRYRIYKKFYENSSYLTITTAEHLDLELFRRIDSEHNKSREHLSNSSDRIKTLEVLRGPSEPTLFD